MLNTDHLLKKNRRSIDEGSAFVLVLGILGLLIGPASGCAGDDAAPEQPAASQAAALQQAAADAGGPPYCNTANPKNTTKFLSILLLQDPDGTPCAASYTISFGVRTTSCSCAVQATCESAAATFAAQAAACPMALW